MALAGESVELLGEFVLQDSEIEHRQMHQHQTNHNITGAT